MEPLFPLLYPFVLFTFLLIFVCICEYRIYNIEVIEYLPLLGDIRYFTDSKQIMLFTTKGWEPISFDSAFEARFPIQYMKSVLSCEKQKQAILSSTMFTFNRPRGKKEIKDVNIAF